ncbi:MAG: CRISPR repeat RNA endoribonuclease Cas6 [Anaerolineae bacterium]|nr:MAG: CRISPR repeat RNA endoribonuclease Cas6 [Anaerolineae bacterium]
MSELLSVLLALKPLPQASPRAVTWWGRATHALFLQAIAQRDAELANQLHDAGQLHPFSVSNLLGRFGRRGELQPDQVYAVRLTACRADVCQALLNAFEPGGLLSEGSQVELDYHPFEVRPTSELPPELSQWRSQADYSTLASPYLLAAQSPPRRLRLQFASPTTFKSNEQHLPLPLPRLVFGNLLERWNAVAPLAFPPELQRYIDQCLTLNRYDLRTRAVTLKEGLLRVGMVGWAEFATLNYDRYWMSLIATLARFALYSSVGAGVSLGLGQIRWLEG